MKISYYAKLIYHLLLSGKQLVSTNHFLKCSPKSTEAIVLGNGPSLVVDLEKLKLLVKGLGNPDIYCVNTFPTSELFKELKPQNLILADGSYWAEDSFGDALMKRTSLINALKNSHPVNIYLPAIVKKSNGQKFIETLEQAGHKVFVYNTFSYNHEFMQKVLYAKNFFMPPPQNVLISALYIAILKKYSKIHLFGVDHSWHRNMYLDKNNHLIIKNEYHDGTVKIQPFYMDPAETKRFNLKELFNALTIMHSSYLEIEEIAKFQNCKILNHTKESYIDAFERVP